MYQQSKDDQDRFLPIANINRIMKDALPKETKISKEARECVQECVSEFIAFITVEACEIVKEERRKTIVGEDILRAMKDLHFSNYVPVIEMYNRKYRMLLKSSKGEEEVEGADQCDQDNNYQSEGVSEEISDI